MRDAIDFVGRLALGVLFSLEAYDTIAHPKSTKALMTTFHLTWSQDLLLWLAVVFLVLGSVMLIIGYRSRLAAFLLLCYWIPVTFIAYAFWNETGVEFRNESMQFVQRMAIAGGLMLIVAHGTGRIAVRKLLATARTPR